MKIPTSKTPAAVGLSGTNFLIYGEGGCGKSRFANQFPNPIFIGLDPGLRGIECAKVEPDNWEDIESVLVALAEDSHGYKTIVIDTIDVMYRMAADWQCRKMNIAHESEKEFGKATSPVYAKLYRVINRLARMPQTLVLISQSTTKEIMAGADKGQRIIPTIPERMRQILHGLMDIVLYFEVRPSGKTIIRSKKSTTFDAKDRFGLVTDMMPLNYAEFAACFEPKNTKGEQK